MTEPAPMENTPAAEPTANTNPAPAATPEQTPAQPAETTPTTSTAKPYFSNEQLAEMQKFAENNGGFEKCFGAMKSAISNPQSKPEPQQSAPQPVPQQQPTPQQPQQPQQMPEGYITRDEYFAAQYFKGLAGEEKYAPVADKIANGEALKEMAAFGINPFENGGINDGKVRQFLDMYSAANAAKQPSQPITNTPTVDYVDVKEINSMADVDQIMRQNISLKAQGKPLHPSTEAAKAFAKSFYASNKKK